MTVDRWIEFSAPARIGVLVRELRAAVDRLLAAKVRSAGACACMLGGEGLLSPPPLKASSLLLPFLPSSSLALFPTIRALK